MSRKPVENVLIPVVGGEWRRLYRPRRYGCYVNDHALIRSHLDGRWHLFGITRPERKIAPYQERYFTHGIGDSLGEPFKEVGVVCDNGEPAWSPSVVYDGDRYFMFYGPSPLRMATSDELVEWRRHSLEIRNCPLDAVHRDPMVLEWEGRWLMYAVGVRKGKGLISVLESKDLVIWEYAGVALDMAGEGMITVPWGALESPTVVRMGEGFYLFVTYTDSERATYHDTYVFHSRDPYRFGTLKHEATGVTNALTRLWAHAPEVVFDTVSGLWWITTCGWWNRGVPIEGAVSIRPLEWQPFEKQSL